MAAEKVQLSMAKVNRDDASKVIAQEMEQVRRQTHLPALVTNVAAIEVANAKIAGMVDRMPRVAGSVRDKMQSVRRGVALANALGNADMEKQAAKEEQDRRRKSARLKQMQKGQGGSKRSDGGSIKANREPPVPASRSNSQRTALLQKAPSHRFPLMHAPSQRITGSPGHTSKQAHSRRSTHMSGPLRVGRRGLAILVERDDSLHGYREDSRVGKLIKEFGGKDDWVSKTVLKHKLATIIQANVRGWLLRLRWWSNPEAVVDSLHAKLHAQATEAERRAKLRRTLEIRALNNKQKKVVSSVVNKLFGIRVAPSAPLPTNGSNGGGSPDTQPAAGMKARGVGGRWAKLQKNADIAVQEMAGERAEKEKALEQGMDPTLIKGVADDQDSEFSDLEMEDITAVKLRAKTPPWQTKEESQWVGQFNKLARNAAQATLEMRWDLSACQERLDGCRTRRMERDPDQEEQDQEEAAAQDPSCIELKPQLIADLLFPKYMEHMARLGLVDPADVPTEAQSRAHTTALPTLTDTTATVAPTLPQPTTQGNNTKAAAAAQPAAAATAAAPV